MVRIEKLPDDIKLRAGTTASVVVINRNEHGWRPGVTGSPRVAMNDQECV
jgi:hypothetical protein